MRLTMIGGKVQSSLSSPSQIPDGHATSAVALIVLQADGTAPLHRTHPIWRSDYTAGNMAGEQCLRRQFGHGRAGSLAEVHVCARVCLEALPRARKEPEAGRTTQRAGGVGATDTAYSNAR